MIFLQLKQSHLGEKVDELVGHILYSLGFRPSDGWDRLVIFLAILLICYLTYLLLSKLFVPLIQTLIRRSGSKFGIHFFQRHFLKRAMSIIPPIIALVLLPLAFAGPYHTIYIGVEKLIYLFLLVMAGRLLVAALSAFYDYLEDKDKVAVTPYKSLFEMGKLISWGIIILFMISTLMEISPIHIITGLSAFAAVLLLVFRDTLLGFIAGIQLAQNHMVKIGDWIVVPESDANGIVVDINILTLQVQNFDNTYVYIPAYNLVTKPFRNWEGMQKSGEWRVNETLQIDIRTVRMPDEGLLKSIFADQKVSTLIGEAGYQAFCKEQTPDNVSFETNLGIFRVWLRYYLANNKDITPKPYQLIRENLVTGMGIPLEIFFFITTTSWLTGYERQAEMLEVIIGMLPRFGLQPFQFDAVEVGSAISPLSKLAESNDEKEVAKNS